ncbi:hypothetical protein L7F22_010772 [Adiantum nelumboides]|nr:hypothetical protein [Adiantum nelumboides]
MRGGCRIMLVVALLALLFVLGVEATTWKVGDSQGWQLNVDYAEWTQGKVFDVGDFLLFTYNTSTENVLEVSAADLASCTTIDPIVTHTDGNSTVLLSNYTTRYFISGIPGHCLASMTLQIHVGSPAPTPSPSPEPGASPLLPPTTIVSPTPSLTPPLLQQVNSPSSPLPSSSSRSWNVPCLVALLAAALGAAVTV